MTSIFLVEDESYALRALQQKIIDLNEDYIIVGMAGNGLTALEEIPSLCPDIVITDIRMPDMDGLTLLEKLKEAGCLSLPILITGYQEFDYALQAVKLGAADYLLKPVSPEELKECLNRTREHLKNRQKNIVSFLIGDDTMSFETAFGQNTFMVIYIIIANPLSTVDNRLHPMVPYLPNEEMEHMASHYFGRHVTRCFEGFFSNEKVLLLDREMNNSGLLLQQLKSLTEALCLQTHEFITVYHTFSESRALASSVRRCRSGAIGNLILGQTGIYDSLPAPKAAAEDNDNLRDTVELYALFLQQNQKELLQANVRKLFQAWSGSRKPYLAVRDNLTFLLDSLKRKYSSKKAIDFDSLYFIENIISFSLNDREYADNFYQLLIEMFTLPDASQKSGEELVESVISYFNHNITSNVTLQTLENETGLSKVYICRIFKKYKNTTPIDYFTRLKIEKAQNMITASPGLSLREISETLGFNDVYYFSKVFKRITGRTPSKQREMF